MQLDKGSKSQAKDHPAHTEQDVAKNTVLGVIMTKGPGDEVGGRVKSTPM